MKGMISSQTRPLTPQPRSGVPWGVVLPWAITAAVLVATAVAMLWPRPVEGNPAPPGQSGALVWGDAVFANPLELQAWLRIRGASYATWAKRHPAGVEILLQAPKPNAPAKPGG